MALPDPSVTAGLQTEEQCAAYLEHLRWPGGVACPNCGNQKISRFQAKGKSGKTRQICQCLDRECKYQFSVTTGTIFHDSHLPLSKWFEAMRLLAEQETGMPVNQLRFVLGVQYKTAKNVAERIQRALRAGTIDLTDLASEGTMPTAGSLVKLGMEYGRKNEAIRSAAAAIPKATEPAAPKPPSGVTTPRKRPAPIPVPPQPASGTPTVVDSMLSVITSAMNLSVKPPLAAVKFLKKKILE